MTRALRILGINILVLLAGLLAIELTLGNWLFGPDFRALNLPRNTTRVFDVEKLYAGGGRITYTRDEHGFRGPYPDVSGIDILTMGGSTTNQLYVDDAKTWQAVMRRLFADAGMDVSVVNAAVDGQSTRGHIAVFDRWFPNVPRLSARYVLVYAGINDMALKNAEQYDDMASPDIGRRFKDMLRNKSALYDAYKIVLGMFAAQRAQVVHGSWSMGDVEWKTWKPLDEVAVDAPDLAELTKAYARRLVTLDERIRGFGAQPIFVTQPAAPYRVRDGWIMAPTRADGAIDMSFVRKLAVFNRTTMRTCRELKAICIDLANDVDFGKTDFYDLVHNTDTGAAKVGRYLFEKLKPVLADGS